MIRLRLAALFLPALTACDVPDGPSGIDAQVDAAPEVSMVAAALFSRDLAQTEETPNLSVLRVRADGQATLYTSHHCQRPVQGPVEGQLNAAELTAFQALLADQNGFVSLGTSVCSSCPSCGLENLAITRVDGSQETAFGQPAFRPNQECTPDERAAPSLFTSGMMALGDWMRARVDDPAFSARLTPVLAERIQVTVHRPGEGRWPEPVQWNFEAINLADLAVKRAGNTVTYTGAERAALWALCTEGYAQWMGADVGCGPALIPFFFAQEGEAVFALSCRPELALP